MSQENVMVVEEVYAGEEIGAHGDKVLVIARQYGEGASSGVSIDMPVYAVWTFEDGLVTDVFITRHRDEALAAVRQSPRR